MSLVVAIKPKELFELYHRKIKNCLSNSLVKYAFLAVGNYELKP
jgi:hypothetical protein